MTLPSYSPEQIKYNAVELLSKWIAQRGEECQKIDNPNRYCDCNYCTYGWVLEQILGVESS